MSQTSKQPAGFDWAGTIPEPSQAPDVTVIVPCYNVERWLEQCLGSVLANDSVRLEVVAVNDGSTDGTLAIMERFAGSDPRVQVIDKPNGGYGMGVNAGLANAHGTYVAIVEPDDYVRPHFYDEALAFARTFDALPQVVKTPYTRVTMPGTPRERLYHCAYFNRIHPKRQPFVLADAPRLIQHHPSIWSALYLRSFLKEKGIRFMEVPGAGWVDNPFLIETLCQAESIVYLEKPFYCYREDLPGSSSVVRSGGLAFERWQQMTDILERLHVADRGIWGAHYVRGFRNAGGVLQDTAVEGTALEADLRRMLERMDAGIVLANPDISDDDKQMFCRVRGLEDAEWEHRSHLRSLANEFAYSLRTNGAGFAFSRVGMYFARRLHIAANDPTKTSSAGI